MTDTRGRDGLRNDDDDADDDSAKTLLQQLAADVRAFASPAVQRELEATPRGEEIFSRHERDHGDATASSPPGAVALSAAVRNELGRLRAELAEARGALAREDNAVARATERLQAQLHEERAARERAERRANELAAALQRRSDDDADHASRARAANVRAEEAERRAERSEARERRVNECREDERRARENESARERDQLQQVRVEVDAARARADELAAWVRQRDEQIAAMRRESEGYARGQDVRAALESASARADCAETELARGDERRDADDGDGAVDARGDSLAAKRPRASASSDAGRHSHALQSENEHGMEDDDDDNGGGRSSSSYRPLHDARRMVAAMREERRELMQLLQRAFGAPDTRTAMAALHNRAASSSAPPDRQTSTDDDANATAEQLRRARAEIAKLERACAAYEQRVLRGEYNPTRTRILHLRDNPTARARERLARSVLGHTLVTQASGTPVPSAAASRDSETRGEQGDGGSDGIAAAVVAPERQQQLQAVADERVVNAEKLARRTHEVAKAKITELLESIYFLFGWRVRVAGATYTLSSMYAESADDRIAFARNAHGGMDLVATDYVDRALGTEVEQFLRRWHSIPAFLSHVTTELFERSTRA